MTAAAAQLGPLKHEALLLRHQQAMGVLRTPDVAGVPAIDSTEQRVSLLAAVLLPDPRVLEWSIDRARRKLDRLTDAA